MNIGVSLSPSFLCGRASSAHQQNMLAGGIQPFQARLRRAGCTHIELRTVNRNTDSAEIAGSVRSALQAGLALTVHSSLADEPAADFWGRLQPVLDVQEDLCVTVHSAASREQTVLLLRRMGEYAAAHHPRARLALENNRTKTGDNAGLVECFGVNDTLEEAGLINAGACWDFGHFYWDRLAHPAIIRNDLPPAAFLSRAVHTHIHSVLSDTTHFPLTMGSLPLAQYLAALKAAGYTGVYNLEPEPERWAEHIDAAEEIVRSVQLLKTALNEVQEVIR